MLVQKERAKTEHSIDVDGDKEGEKYNNCFINPKEWLVDNLDNAEVQKHLLSSIELLAKLISAGKKVRLFKTFSPPCSITKIYLV